MRRTGCTPGSIFGWRNRQKGVNFGLASTGQGLNFYFAGDTGYTPRLQDIASRLGSPDIAALPIGAYEPRWFMRTQHVNPPEAVDLHRRLGVRRSLAIHWGTFELADDSLDAPILSLQESLRQQDLTPDDFWVIRQGESRQL